MRKILPFLFLLGVSWFLGACNPKDEPTDNNVSAADGVVNQHGYVDLGLPSGTLWATCNLGASKPSDKGHYYAWGETTTKSDYTWDTYKWVSEPNEYSLTKYCHDEQSGAVDNLWQLETMDDAARAAWGVDWRIPTDDEWSELSQECTFAITQYQGVLGCLITGPNGKAIFLPAAGLKEGKAVQNDNVLGFYWTANTAIDYSYQAFYSHFDQEDYWGTSYQIDRCMGGSVRPVLDVSE